MMNLRHVQAFLAIARLGSFHAAARALATTQPSISMWVRNLERELGGKLFSTEGRRAKLTQKGRDFVPYANDLIERVDVIHARMASEVEIAGTIRLGATETSALTWLPQMVEDVKRLFPDVVLEIDVELPVGLWAKHEAGLLDILVVPGPVRDPSLRYHLLGKSCYRWMSSPHLEVPVRQLSPRELSRFPIISLSASSALFQIAERWFAENGASPNWVSHCSSLSVVAALTRSALGVSLLLPGLMKEDVANDHLRIIDIQPTFPEIEVYTVYSTHAITPRLRAVLDIITDVSGRIGMM
jgi:DNA-binding transcriptional LysR family regulator